MRTPTLGAFLVLSLLLATSSHASGDALPTVEPARVGMSVDRLERISPLVKEAHQAGEFSGCVVLVSRRGGVVFKRAVGDRQVEPHREPMTTDTVFDLASLTKPIATATSVMLLFERGQVRLSDPVSHYLEELDRAKTRDITIEQLLTHAAGFVPDNSLKDYRDGPEEAWRRLLALDPKWPPGTEFKYSDVGFELLGKLVERVSGKPLDRFAREEIYEPLGMHETTYLPGPELRARAATTEKRDGEWLKGEVHDPRSALLGGVAGHAGLFSTVDDLACYAQMMLDGGRHNGRRVLAPLTIREMTRARDVAGARRAAGWDVRSGYSRNRGDLLSDSAFGHGGFTGTGIWIDPELEMSVIFLSSRLHPDGEGTVNDLIGRIGTVAAAAIIDVGEKGDTADGEQ